MATVLAAVMIAAIIVVAVMVVDVGAAVSARHRAQAAADLAALNFPLPVKKNDRITLFDDAGNEVDVLNVTTVDAYKRAAAGAIELKAAGVQ